MPAIIQGAKYVKKKKIQGAKQIENISGIGGWFIGFTYVNTTPHNLI